MAEKGMIFCSDMVRALLDKRKFSTMRVIKPQPIIDFNLQHISFIHKKHTITTSYPRLNKDGLPIAIEMMAKYQVGDRIYVKETWQKIGDYPVCYLAGKSGCGFCETHTWKPSIFMPKSLARIFFTITEIDVVRPQDLTGNDILLEGFDSKVHPTADYFNMNQKDMFKRLWNALHGDGAWERNEWCFRYKWKEIIIK